MCTEEPDDKQYIVQGHTEDQAGQDIQAEDVVQAKNLVWYTWAKRRVSQCTHLYITSNEHSGIGPLLVNKHQLSLKSDTTLKLQIFLDPDQIPLTYMSVTCTDY